MEFEVLGPIRVRSVTVTGRLQKILLGTLLANANRDVPASALVDVLWPGKPTTPRRSCTCTSTS